MRLNKHWRNLAFLTATIAASTIAAGAQTPQVPTPAQTPASADVVVTGCLVQGSSTTVFLLDNARRDLKDSKEVGKRYFLVSKIEDTPLKDLLNHEVTVTGTVTSRSDVRPVTPPAAEKDLPVMTARSIASIADGCMANAGR